MTAKPNYTLTYFNARGRAEISRLILAYSGVKFTDTRITGEEWLTLKEKTPWNVLPILSVDGKILSQSSAVARYLAREYEIAGKDDWDQALADSVVDVVNDIRDALIKLGYNKDESKTAELTKAKDDTVTKTLSNLEMFAEDNKAGPGCLVGNEVTWADLCLADIASHLEDGTVEKYPKLSAVVDKVNNHPKLAEYLKNRPETYF